LSEPGSERLGNNPEDLGSDAEFGIPEEIVVGSRVQKFGDFLKDGGGQGRDLGGQIPSSSREFRRRRGGHGKVPGAKIPSISEPRTFLDRNPPTLQLLAPGGKTRKFMLAARRAASL
jgi:hypothetical protein